MEEKLKLYGFNNLTKSLSFNIYDICYAKTEREQQDYIKYIDSQYNSERLTNILSRVTEMIGAKILNIATQDYDPQGASVTLLVAEEAAISRGEKLPRPTSEAVAMHLDKSHVTVHTYPEYHPDTSIATFRVDIDVATCGTITPLKTLDYLISNFDSDIITMDYRVRGFTRDITGKKLFMEHRMTSIQDYIKKETLDVYDAVDINIYQANLFHTRMLIKELDRMGIGRPSTFTAIIDTIMNREYVFKKKGGGKTPPLIPTWTAFVVCQLLESHFPELIDYDFTAEMESQLDEISRGELDCNEYLKTFYFGGTGAGAHPGLKTLTESKVSEISARDISQILIGTPVNPDGTPGEPVYVRVGRYGPFLQQGENQTGIPDMLPPDELTLEKAEELFRNASQKEEPLGVDPESGKKIYVKVGRFGPYVQRGDAEDGEKPQNASLLKGMNPATLTLDEALGLLSLPRVLGVHPESGEEIVANNGRFGPYVKCGTETRSLGTDYSPISITLQEALDLLAKPKFARRGETAKKSAPLKVLGDSPVTGNPVQLMDGRYGPYVTDGTTNASLPRDMAQEELTFEIALDLLEKRAAKGKVTRTRTRRTTAKKAAAPKKTVKKAAAAVKKTAAKKTTKKKTEG